MTLSAIGGATAPYDPLSQAIAGLGSSDLALASKLTGLQKQIDAMAKGGASDDAIGKAIDSTIDGLSDTEFSELDAAIPDDFDSASEGEEDGTSGSFSLNSFLDATGSMPNDSIVGFLSLRSE